MNGLAQAAFAASLLINLAGGAYAVRIVRRRGGWRFVRSWLVARGAMRDEAKERFEGAYGAHKRSLYERLAIAPGDVVMLGDSLTEGGEWAELLGDPRVKNRGISGDTVEALLARLASIVAGRPARLFVLAGVNDLLNGATVEAVADAYRRLLEAVAAGSPETRVVVQSCLPLDPTVLGVGDNAVIQALNARLRALAEAHGATYLDLYPRFEDGGRLASGLSHDGLHLAGPAYLRWRDAIAPLLD